MIKDYEELSSNVVFHFKHSLRPFICVYPSFFSASGEKIFIDIHDWIAYTKEELTIEGLEFYTKEDSECFEGVRIDGFLKDWL